MPHPAHARPGGTLLERASSPHRDIRNYHAIHYAADGDLQCESRKPRIEMVQFETTTSRHGGAVALDQPTIGGQGISSTQILLRQFYESQRA
jgi:hypothetical protein